MLSNNTQAIPPPVYRTRFLIFDVETTGLLPKSIKNNQPTPINEYPHIIQLSFAIYDYDQKKIIQEYDSYIDIDETIEIPSVVSNLTGITKDICKAKGNPIIDVLEKFYEAYMFCQVLVAHNIDFDEKMILVELERNRPNIMELKPHCFMTFNEMYEKVHGIERYCTMKKGTDLCNIMVESKIPGRKSRKKWPRLNELYSTLFDNKNVSGLHNSMIDVLVCLSCFLKMRHNYSDENLMKIL
jgi:DNA polymerase III subunit epsilon